MTRLRRISGWALAGLALLHLLALLALYRFSFQTVWGTRLLIGLATLWFLWPIVILIRRTRIVWKVVSLVLIALPMIPIFRLYDRIGDSVFDWPRGFSADPVTAVIWTKSYLAGRADAKKDIKDGELMIEDYGFGAGGGHRFFILRDRYAIKLNATAQCLVDSRILGHACGYNSVSRREIERRYGAGVIEAAFEEGWKLDREAVLRWEECGKELARRISTLPPNSKITLESVRLFGGPAGRIEEELSPADIRNLGEITHWVESLLSSIVADDSSSFETHITAHLYSSAPSYLTITSNAPDPIHEEIERNLENAPHLRSEREDIIGVMHFQIHNEIGNRALAEAK